MYRATVCVFILLCIAVTLQAATSKPIENINSDALTNELQATTTEERFEMVWWIPQEFWAVTLKQSADVSDEMAQPLLDQLEPYAMLAVVQADISPLGAFDYYDEQTVLSHLRLIYSDAEGAEHELMPLDAENLPGDVTLLQQQITPLLKAAMGPMGSHLWFFTFKAIDDHQEQIMSPYEAGQLTINTADGVGEHILKHRFQFPLDSLFVPRRCPNGRDAHISWKFCPWTGEALPE